MMKNLYHSKFQIRRQARLRREYLYRKGVEERQKAIQDKKDRLKRALDGNLFQPQNKSLHAHSPYFMLFFKCRKSFD